MENPLGDLEPPDHIEPHLREEDLIDLDKRDRKTLFAISVLDQRILWCIDTIIKQNTILGLKLGTLETELYSLRLQQNQLAESNRNYTWQWRLIKWSTIITIGGIIGAAIKKGIDKIWP